MFSLFLCFFLLISSCIYFFLCFNPSNCTFTSKMINYWGAATFVSNFHSLRKPKQNKPHKLPRPNSCKTLCNRWRNGNTGSNMKNYLTSFDNGCHSCICSMLLFDVCFLSGFEVAVNWGCVKCWQYKVCKQKTHRQVNSVTKISDYAWNCQWKFIINILREWKCCAKQLFRTLFILS